MLLKQILKTKKKEQTEGFLYELIGKLVASLLTSFDIQRCCQNEHKYNGVYSRNNLT